MPATQKITRVVTRHFINCTMILSRDQLSLLSWLVYNCSMDNEITFNTLLLRRYCESVKAVRSYYKGKHRLNVSLPAARRTFIWLLENGYIIKVKQGIFLNPMITYRADYITTAQFKVVADQYQQDPAGAVQAFSNLVNERFKHGKAHKG